jgi:hypothetical protein
VIISYTSGWWRLQDQHDEGVQCGSREKVEPVLSTAKLLTTIHVVLVESLSAGKLFSGITIERHKAMLEKTIK